MLIAQLHDLSQLLVPLLSLIGLCRPSCTPVSVAGHLGCCHLMLTSVMCATVLLFLITLQQHIKQSRYDQFGEAGLGSGFGGGGGGGAGGFEVDLGDIFESE